MRRTHLPLLAAQGAPGSPDSLDSLDPHALGVLSIHLQGGRCAVGCPFCYLGQREGAAQPAMDLDLLEEALARLPYREVAVALSEPAGPFLPAVRRIARAVARRGRLLALTTTPRVAETLGAGDLEGVGRLSLSVDPWKEVVVARLAQTAARLGERTGAEIVLIVTLATPGFARELFSGLLAEMVAIPSVDRVALSALKPPPRWCDRRFWLAALARLAPLLERELDRRLFLDCYVAARILGLGGCPARPDLSPAGMDQPKGHVAFRACVYQRAPDMSCGSFSELAGGLRGFRPPAACPFPIP